MTFTKRGGERDSSNWKDGKSDRYLALSPWGKGVTWVS